MESSENILKEEVNKFKKKSHDLENESFEKNEKIDSKFNKVNIS